MSSFKHLALPAVGLLVLVGYWLWRGTAAPPVAPTSPPAKTATPERGGPRSGSGPSDDPLAKPTTTAKAPAAAPSPSSPPPATRKDRAQTEALRLQLRNLRTGSGGTRKADEAPAEAEPAGTLDKDYIQARIREDLVPIAQECYESALEDEPKLGGKLVMKFSIVGDESVGGVVDEAEVDATSDITHPALRECMKESMLSLSFPPPEGGGTVSVTYPFVFASDGEPAPAK